MTSGPESEPAAAGFQVGLGTFDITVESGTWPPEIGDEAAAARPAGVSDGFGRYLGGNLVWFSPASQAAASRPAELHTLTPDSDEGVLPAAVNDFNSRVTDADAVEQQNPR